jgi:DNA-binding NarL/FixJ family response regulator
MEKRIRVLVVDDQRLFAGMLRQALESERALIARVEVAYDGENALRLVQGYRPDVVLMDVHMPGMDGVEATARILQLCPAAKVLMLSAFGYDDYVNGALEAGAHGYLLKDVSPDDLLDAIRKTAKGEVMVLSSEVKEAIVGRRSRKRQEAGGSADWLRGLTPRERGILSLMARGYSNSEIAKAVNLGEQTIRNYTSSLYDRMHVRNRFEAIRKAIEARIDVGASE